MSNHRESIDLTDAEPTYAGVLYADRWYAQEGQSYTTEPALAVTDMEPDEPTLTHHEFAFTRRAGRAALVKVTRHDHHAADERNWVCEEDDPRTVDVPQPVLDIVRKRWGCEVVLPSLDGHGEVSG